MIKMTNKRQIQGSKWLIKKTCFDRFKNYNDSFSHIQMR